MFLITSDRYPGKKKTGEFTADLRSQCSSSKAFLRRSSSARSALGALIRRDVLELSDVTISGIQYSLDLSAFSTFYMYTSIYIVYSIYIIYTCVTHHPLSSCLENPGNLLVFVFVGSNHPTFLFLGPDARTASCSTPRCVSEKL